MSFVPSWDYHVPQSSWLIPRFACFCPPAMLLYIPTDILWFSYPINLPLSLTCMSSQSSSSTVADIIAVNISFVPTDADDILMIKLSVHYSVGHRSSDDRYFIRLFPPPHRPHLDFVSAAPLLMFVCSLTRCIHSTSFG